MTMTMTMTMSNTHINNMVSLSPQFYCTDTVQYFAEQTNLTWMLQHIMLAAHGSPRGTIKLLISGQRMYLRIFIGKRDITIRRQLPKGMPEGLWRFQLDNYVLRLEGEYL